MERLSNLTDEETATWMAANNRDHAATIEDDETGSRPRILARNHCTSRCTGQQLRCVLRAVVWYGWEDYPDSRWLPAQG